MCIVEDCTNVCDKCPLLLIHELKIALALLSLVHSLSGNSLLEVVLPNGSHPGILLIMFEYLLPPLQPSFSPSILFPFPLASVLSSSSPPSHSDLPLLLLQDIWLDCEPEIVLFTGKTCFELWCSSALAHIFNPSGWNTDTLSTQF